MTAGRALAALAADPAGTVGVVIRGGPGPARDAWLAALREVLPPGMPVGRLPPGITADRLLGGLDLGATLAAGRPVVRAGLLAELHGGVLLVPMAERLAPAVVAALVEALDTGSIRVEREGQSAVHPARIHPVFLDESEPDEAGVAPALMDRAGPVVELHPRWRPSLDPPRGEGAGAPSPVVSSTETPVAPLVEAAHLLGIASLRPVLRTVGVARALARADGASGPDEGHLAEAASLVLAPRATRRPPPPEEDAPAPPAAPPAEAPMDGAPPGDAGATSLADRVLEAIRPALPPGLMGDVASGGTPLRAPAAAGRTGEERRRLRTGRTAGSRPGDPTRGGRVDAVATIRAAAPWQRLRMEAAAQAGDGPTGSRRLHIRKEDLRIRILAARTSTTAIFLVDASGSQALNRLAEAKGAVELLLAESYVRREAVALVAFRGSVAEVLLPPTRALARARRALAGLPGGGGTPLAAGLEAGLLLAEQVRRDGSSPVLVILTDGRANVARDGRGGREGAGEDARGMARRVAVRGIPSLLVDSSPRGSPPARELAGELRGRYLQLPGTDPHRLASALRETGGGP